MVEPVMRDENDMSQMMGGMQQMGLAMNGPSMAQRSAENALVAKLVHLLDNDDTDVVYEMLTVARQHINQGGNTRAGQTLVAVVFASFRLAQRVFDIEHGRKDATAGKSAASDEANDTEKTGAEEKAEEKKGEGEATVEEGEATAEDGEATAQGGETTAEGDEREKVEGAADGPESTTPSTPAEPKEDAPDKAAEAGSTPKSVR